MMTAQERDALVVQYHYLCSRAGRKFIRAGVERADLEQIAAIGLLKACDRYDAAQQTPFEAFAWLLILGEMMHYVRDQERLVRAPRRLRNLERKCQAAYEHLVEALGREPNPRELAEQLRVGYSEVQEVMLYREQAVPHSLDAVAEPCLRKTCYTIDERVDRLVMEDALERLSRAERTIVLALHVGGYSQIEVAAKLGYSRRHVSRLHRSALKKMQPVWVPQAQ